MSLASNTAQTRELTELRNHLKWLDEERRKSGRKMAELEQRLAQQGRDLAERDLKIQELERHAADFSERFERMPDQGSNTAGIEQRLQDLEWHLSNMNAQLNRVPNMDEERARFQDEISRAISAARVQAESNQAVLENRLQSEIVALRSSGDLGLRVEEQAQSIREIDQRFATLQESVTILSAQRPLENLGLRVEEQAQSIREIDQQFVTLQESVSILSGQLRERTNTLAAEAQANYSSLAAGMQEQLDTFTTDWEARIHEIQATRSDEISPAILRLDTQQAQHYEELSNRLSLIGARIDESLEGNQSNLDTLAAEWQTRFQTQEQVAGLVDPLAAHLADLEEKLTKLGLVRDVMPLLDRLEQELELRQAEEVRLSNLIGTQENRFAPLAASLEEITESNSAVSARLAESEMLIDELRGQVQDLNENWKPRVTDLNHRIQPIADRAAVFNNNIMRAEASIQTLSEEQSELREMITTFIDDTDRKQSETSRQIEGWQITMDENKDTIERFTQQWITLSNQYKEARMAVQNFAHWQKQLEQQKREASEMLRVESNRMQSRWDGFLMEVQEKLKNFELELNQKWQAFEIDNEQKWSVARRSEQVRHEEMAAIDDLIQKLQQDNRNLIWRVQTAQADAIKKWPRLLMEEVEKAVEINPNRRLPSTAAPRADMSVVDAIEQGLITIDYSDDPGVDL